MKNNDFPVFICGGGPVGLVLSIELAWRGVHSILVNTEPTTAVHPQGNTHNSRTMEHYRRLGIADRIRGVGLPVEMATDVIYLTRLSGHTIARIKMPSSTKKRRQISKRDVSILTPEPIHRASQLYVEPELFRHAQKLKEIDLRFGWELIKFKQEPNGIISKIRNSTSGKIETVYSKWLVGCDGAKGHVRQTLKIPYLGEGGDEVAFFIGRMLSIYIDAPGIYDIIKTDPGWQYWTINADSRTCFVTLDAKGKFVVLTKYPESKEPDETDIISDLQKAIGAKIDIQIISVREWTAGNALVAERYGVDNVLIAGDAAHLFTPTGGFGMNTGVEDAVNLGWKLAAAQQGWTSDKIINTYEIERKPIGIRNTVSSRKLASDVATIQIADSLELNNKEGERARAKLGNHLATFKEEFASLGIQLGARYDSSPLIISDGSEPPRDSPVEYVPSASPGGRAPHVWLEDGSSIYDRFGKWFTLLRLGENKKTTSAIEIAASLNNIPLKIIDIHEQLVCDKYSANFVLIRPDQHIAWRGNTIPSNAENLIKTISGNNL